MSVQQITNGKALGLRGIDGGPGEFINAPVSFVGVAPVSQLFFIATRSMRVEAIRARMSTAGAAASTLTVQKVPAGTAIGAGTNVMSNTFDMTLTTNQSGTLTLAVATIFALDLIAGDALALIVGGTPGVCAGTVNVGMTPL